MKSLSLLLVSYVCFSVFVLKAQPGHINTIQIGSGGNDEAVSLVVDGDGNVIMAGFFGDTADFDPGAGEANLISAGGNDIYIVKYDANGSLIWVKQIQGSTSGVEVATSITLDESSNILISGYMFGSADFDPGAGTYTLTSNGDFDAFIAKYNSSGSFLWARNMGGIDRDIATSVKTDQSGNVHVTGYFYGTADFDPGAGTLNLVNSTLSSNVFVAKYDASGNVLWANGFGDLFSDIGFGIEVDNTGNVYTAGYFTDSVDINPGSGIMKLYSAGSEDVFIQKLDASGNFLWGINLGGVQNDRAYSIKLDKRGNIITTGYFSGSGDFDPGINVHNLSNGNIFISKLNSSGQFIWAKNFEGVGGGFFGNSGNALFIDGNNNILSTGTFAQTIDFDPDAGVYSLTSAGSDDAYLSMLDSAGNFICAAGMGGTHVDKADGIGADGNGNVYTAGKFFGTADFDPGSGTHYLTSAGEYDIFLNKTSACVDPTGVKNDAVGKSISIMPNPNKGQFSIQMEGIEAENVQVKIYDSSGKAVVSLSGEKCVGRNLIEVSEELEQGIYLIGVFEDGIKIKSEKIVVAK